MEGVIISQSAPDSFFDIGIYKSNSHARTGKYAVPRENGLEPETPNFRNIRGKQMLVLQYFVEHEYAVATPSMIAYWLKEKQYVNVESDKDFVYLCKKLYDSINALVKRGLLIKVRRGYYTLSELGRKIASLLVSRIMNRKPEVKVNRETDSGSLCAGDRGCAGGVVDGVGVHGGVLRFHVFGGGGVEPLERLVLSVEFVYRYVVWLRRYLRGVLGVGVYRRLARRVGLRFVGVPVVGVHGGVGGGLRRVLKPVSYAKYGFSEVGVDVPIETSVGRLHVKVYLAPLSVYYEHLERFKPRLHVPLSVFAR